MTTNKISLREGICSVGFTETFNAWLLDMFGPAVAPQRLEMLTSNILWQRLREILPSLPYAGVTAFDLRMRVDEVPQVTITQYCFGEPGRSINVDQDVKIEEKSFTLELVPV